MSNEKLKSENYQAFGGINSKFSPYSLGPMEFLDLVNVDFHVPGSLSQRWGTTLHISASGPVTGLYEFERTTGYSGLAFSHSGSIKFANFQTIVGVSSPFQATLLTWDPVSSATVGTGARSASVPIYMMPSIFGGNFMDYSTFNNRLYLADGNIFYKFDGSTLSMWGLPPVLGATYGITTAIGGQPARGHFGGSVISVALSYVNLDFQEGPVTYMGYADLKAVAAATFVACSLPYVIPDGFQIIGINLYESIGASPQPFGPFYLRQSVIQGSSLLAPTGTDATGFGSKSGGTMLSSATIAPSYVYPFIGVTVPPGTGSTTALYSVNLPSMLEIFSNQLFMAGMADKLSTLLFSDIGKGEQVSPQNSIEIRTNDGDRITGIKTYNQRLMIGKAFSIHQLMGEDTDNFVISQLSSEYGLYNNRCSTVYGDLFAFLDRKGIVEFNGAALNLISFKIQPIIDRINQGAAVTHACMVHDKVRNQILVGVPIDGATINNYTLAYDYIAKAWTTYKGFTPEIFAKTRSILGREVTFFGGFSGNISYFGPSLFSDNGTGFSMLIKSRFVHDMGDSIQKQFRYLYVNIDAPSSTLAIPVNFYQDYGSSVVLGRTLVISRFQDRLDFGISAKSVAFEMFQTSINVPFRFNGYTLDERMQRKEGSR